MPNLNLLGKVNEGRRENDSTYFTNKKSLNNEIKFMARRGIEPVTFALLARRSNQLS